MGDTVAEKAILRLNRTASTHTFTHTDYSSEGVRFTIYPCTPRASCAGATKVPIGGSCKGRGGSLPAGSCVSVLPSGSTEPWSLTPTSLGTPAHKWVLPLPSTPLPSQGDLRKGGGNLPGGKGLTLIISSFESDRSVTPAKRKWWSIQKLESNSAQV